MLCFTPHLTISIDSVPAAVPSSMRSVRRRRKPSTSSAPLRPVTARTRPRPPESSSHATSRTHRRVTHVPVPMAHRWIVHRPQCPGRLRRPGHGLHRQQRHPRIRPQRRRAGHPAQRRAGRHGRRFAGPGPLRRRHRAQAHGPDLRRSGDRRDAAGRPVALGRGTGYLAGGDRSGHRRNSRLHQRDRQRVLVQALARAGHQHLHRGIWHRGDARRRSGRDSAGKLRLAFGVPVRRHLHRRPLRTAGCPSARVRGLPGQPPSPQRPRPPEQDRPQDRTARPHGTPRGSRRRQ